MRNKLEYNSPDFGQVTSRASEPMKEFNVNDAAMERRNAAIAAAAKQNNTTHQQRQNMNESFSQFQDYDSDQELLKEVQAARKLKNQGKYQVSDSTRQRIEFLLGLGKATRSVEIEHDGNMVVFELKTLSAKDITTIALLKYNKTNEEELFFNMVSQTLAKSIYSIDNIPLFDLIGSSEDEDCLSFVQNLDESIIQRLFVEYLDMKSENNNKYSIKSNKDAKEVQEDLKK